ncbi:uncharacterized protein LOC119682003 [Teleopsis dalmanni]|uniref:uncharacterized protein LOC119682003 n=1 Tax=Teleopsis dalmanni TaxID=139649 RepID=UPI0018CFC7C8|nr:uncharacterized protein LOC119682003 [Teleopsis dalmanni]
MAPATNAANTTMNRTTHGTSNNKYQQLKRKSHETRQKLLQQSQQQLLSSYDSNLLHDRHNTLTLTPQLTHMNSSSTQALTTAHMANISPIKRSTLSLQRQHECSNDSTDSNVNDLTAIAAQYYNIDEDYRKNLFGTIPSRKFASQSAAQMCNNNSPQLSNDEDETVIVNAAFDEIFAGYSGVDEDDDDGDCDGDGDNDDEFTSGGNAVTSNSLTPGEENLVSLSELDDDVFKAASVNDINNFGRPGNTPKRLTTLAHKKPAPPPPPLLSKSNSHIHTLADDNSKRLGNGIQVPSRRAIMPLSAQKERATTVSNLFDRLKSTQIKPKHILSKTPSDNLLKREQLNVKMPTASSSLHKFPPQMDLHREVEGEENTDNMDNDFLRGSTLSQSFVKHLKLRKQTKPPAPAPPVLTPQHNTIKSRLPVGTKKSQINRSSASVSNSTTTCSPLRSVLNHLPKRSKSSNELLLDDLAIQSRKYNQTNRRYFEPTTNLKAISRRADGASFKRQRFSVLRGNAAEI